MRKTAERSHIHRKICYRTRTRTPNLNRNRNRSCFPAIAVEIMEKQASARNHIRHCFKKRGPSGAIRITITIKITTATVISPFRAASAKRTPDPAVAGSGAFGLSQLRANNSSFDIRNSKIEIRITCVSRATAQDRARQALPAPESGLRIP